MIDMHARAPLDVDFEDKLLYGLTPMRLAYLLMALLGGFAFWSSRWAPSPVRAVACLVVVGVGMTVAYGRWHGRAADAWLTDIAIFMIRNHRIEWNGQWTRRLQRRASHSDVDSCQAEPAPADIVVALG